MTIANASAPDANDVLNIFHANLDTHIKASGSKKIYVYINNVSGVRNVYLYLRGEVADMPLVVHNHSHDHTGNTGSTAASAGSGSHGAHTHTISGDTTNEGDLTDGTDVPQAVEIWIDGTQYTATIGDPNTKGATMYDSGNDDWGVDGTTIWNTGKLDLTSVISWTAGEHYIELKETGATGGRLIANVMVNTGFGA